MRTLSPILIFILILNLRQDSSVFIADHFTGCNSILQEKLLVNGTQGLGWFENTDKGDPDRLPPVFQAFQNQEQMFIGTADLRHFRYLIHVQTNPLLIDKPPPSIGA